MMLFSNCPSIDLHGMDREYAVFKTKEFIQDNYKLKRYYISVIHGVGEGILRKEIHNYLKHERLVLEYKLNIFNSGETLIKLVEKN